MEPGGIDGELQGSANACRRHRFDPSREEGPFLGEQARLVLRSVTRLDGDARGRHVKEDERVGAEFLEYLDRDLNARQVRPRVRRIVENLWADTEDDPIDVARRTSDGVERHSKLAELDQVGVQTRLSAVHRRRANARPNAQAL